MEDKHALTNCALIAEIGLELFGLRQEIINLESAQRKAHEEGMLQISTGIIHNIGNGINVIQLALARLQEFGSIQEISEFLKKEILPAIKKQVKEGKLQEFLTSDPQGKEYINVLDSVTEQIAKQTSDFNKEFDFINNKFHNITDIITLQQHFIGELGTENISPITPIIEDVLKMCQGPIEESGIILDKDFGTTADILIDTALFSHILLLLIKYAIESINRVYRSPASLKIHTTQKSVEISEKVSKDFIEIIIVDNGYGIEFDPKQDNLYDESLDQQTRDLWFCKQRIEKYEGKFQVKAEIGRGSTVTVMLPVYEKSSSSDSK